MKIILKDYELTACHGVNPEEKIRPQRFLISAEIEADCEAAAARDDIDETISYSAVKKAIKAFAEGNCFDLIETLADGLARMILDDFDRAQGVRMTVKKPDAPMSGKFDYVAVVCEKKWTRAYLALGSSLGDRQAYLDFAVSELKSARGVRNVRESGRIATAPYGNVAKEEFLNSVAEIYTYLSPTELLSVANAIESRADRERLIRWDDRTLDIDIILYGDEIISKNGLYIPHIDMSNRDFVLRPLCELNEYAMNPILGKTARQLLDELNKR